MATLTIKNFPDTLYAQLTKVARKNRRSINSEAIVSVERGLDRPGLDDELLAQIRRGREEMAKKGVRVTDEILARSRAELLDRPRQLMAELNERKVKPSTPGSAKTK